MSENSSARKSKVVNWLPSAAIAAATAMVIASAAPVRAQDLSAAANNYKDSCADCHGASGKGDGPKAAKLKTKAADYTNCAEMKKLDDDYMFKIIKNGGESLGKPKDMADFGKAYDDDEIKGLVAYVRSFCKQ